MDIVMWLSIRGKEPWVVFGVRVEGYTEDGRL